jgi:hypothetical protein
MNAGYQLARAKRLVHVLVSTLPESGDPRFLNVVRRQNDDGRTVADAREILEQV